MTKVYALIDGVERELIENDDYEKDGKQVKILKRSLLLSLESLKIDFSYDKEI